MATAPKARTDLEYFDLSDDVIVVHDPVRKTWLRFNPLQAAMLRALDGVRSPDEIAQALSTEFDAELAPEQIERFITRTRDLMLLELGSYTSTPAHARKLIRKAIAKAGFQLRAPASTPDRPRVMTRESELFAEAFRQLDLGHPRAAASYLTAVLRINPNNTRARRLYEIVQSAYMKSFGGTTDYPTFVLFDPSRLLTWLSRTCGAFVLSWRGGLALLALVIAGLHAATLIDYGSITFSALDIFLAYAFVTLGNLVHELGHGFVCQHYGGKVTEIGYTLMFYFRIVPYCDTSSSYLISNRRHKMMVQLGGTLASIMWFSLLAVGLALLAPSIAIYSGLALGLLVGAAFSFLTLIPFLKNDGYYALADALNIPNLRERSFKQARAWIAKKLFGLELETEDLSPRQRRWMIAYGIGARLFTMCFVLFIFLRLIAVPLVESFRGLGLGIVVLLSAYLFRNAAFRPLGRGIATLVRERRRVFTPARTVRLALIAALVVVPWLVIRWPVLVDSEFVIVPEHRVDVRARTAGRVANILVAEGARVTAGQPIAILENPELMARIAMLEADLAVADHQLAALQVGARDEELAVARSRVAHERSEARLTAMTASRARRLARAHLGTQSLADAARQKLAAQTGNVDAARADLSLLEAGTQPERIAVADAARARIAGELAHLRAEAKLLTLTSPIAGVIATKHLEDKLHESLAPGDLFAAVHDPDVLIAELALAENDPLSELAVGDEVVLKPYGVPGADIRVRVARFRQAVADNRVVAVTTPFAFERPIAGLSGRARVYGNEHSLAYANFYLPVARIIRVQLWSL
jgi:multidrug efflux pump subunit AcrA (membrane-fusion protein)